MRWEREERERRGIRDREKDRIEKERMRYYFLNLERLIQRLYLALIATGAGVYLPNRITAFQQLFLPVPNSQFLSYCYTSSYGM